MAGGIAGTRVGAEGEGTNQRKKGAFSPHPPPPNSAGSAFKQSPPPPASALMDGSLGPLLPGSLLTWGGLSRISLGAGGAQFNGD